MQQVMKKPHFTIENITGKPYFKVEDDDHIYFIPDGLRPDVESYLHNTSTKDMQNKADLTDWYLSLPHQVKTTLIVAVNKNIH